MKKVFILLLLVLLNYYGGSITTEECLTLSADAWKSITTKPPAVQYLISTEKSTGFNLVALNLIKPFPSFKDCQIVKLISNNNPSYKQLDPRSVDVSSSNVYMQWAFSSEEFAESKFNCSKVIIGGFDKFICNFKVSFRNAQANNELVKMNLIYEVYISTALNSAWTSTIESNFAFNDTQSTVITPTGVLKICSDSSCTSFLEKDNAGLYYLRDTYFSFGVEDLSVSSSYKATLMATKITCDGAAGTLKAEELKENVGFLTFKASISNAGTSCTIQLDALLKYSKTDRVLEHRILETALPSVQFYKADISGIPISTATKHANHLNSLAIVLLCLCIFFLFLTI